jgi:signal transduction histidine kinase
MAKIRARARAVDMLGRQQIAGIQNAVSELFKNAHDAYATLARVDFIESHKLLLVRDNGVGMTKVDFEGKWLVLGTESKLGSESEKHYRPAESPPRPITGEKGIGRLAIALLGSEVLVLSRAQRLDGPQPLVAGLVHWGLFELPGVNLDEIEIPVATFKGGALPSADDIAALSQQLLSSIERISSNHPTLDLTGIRRDVTTFRPDPEDLDTFMGSHDDGQLSLRDNGTGTHFIIAPANEVLSLEIEGEERMDDYGFRKQLLGFCNEVFLASPPPRVATSFRYWRPGAVVPEELLGSEAFFSAKELQDADHQLVGKVDEFGQFSGTLRVYEKIYENLQVAWPDSMGNMTETGPFQIIFGYVMGLKSESRIPPDEYDEINDKLDRIGGMYIYRDDIRVLPYGDHSFDWLEVEKRRNKGAAYYFFSFRRMFGAVILTRRHNANLVEKAGREGWQQNRSFRELKEILVNLLVNLAAEFFRKGGVNTEVFEQHQTDLKRKAALLEKRDKQVSARKKRFSQELDKFAEGINAGVPFAAISSLKQQMQASMQAAALLPDQDQAASALIRAERDALERIKALREQFSLRKPSGIGLSRDLQERWHAYQSERARLEGEYFKPFEDSVVTTLGAVAKQARVYINQRRRLEDKLKAIQVDREKSLNNIVQQARSSANETRNTVLEVTQRAVQSFDGVYRRIESDMARTNFERLDENQVEALQKQWEEQLLDVEQRHRESLEAARDMLAALSTNLKSPDESGRPQLMDREVVEAIEERMLALEEQADEDFEMVQMGMAVAIINHEFAAAIKNVRRSIQELGHIARGSTGIRPLYESIRSNFEHLDGHLNLFTPLQRRLHRNTLAISGKRIHEYITDLFSNRLSRHKVQLDSTSSFLASSIQCFPSTIYPVLINLVDNAIHWLSTDPARKTQRLIRLDAEVGALIVANNGPSIPERDQLSLFERGFTRKRGGRGLGLFIARKALLKEKMDIFLSAPPAGFSVAFRIVAPTLTFLK